MSTKCPQLLYLQDDMEVVDKPQRIKKSLFSLQLLQGWYEELYLTETPKVEIKKEKCKNKKKVLVVIIPDFEAFNPEVLQRFILIAYSYINVLPIVIVLGIATSLSTLHTSLPYHVSSKVSVQVFHSKPSTEYLNKVLEDVFFTLDCPFQLGGKVFNLFVDIFLFYDFSVSGFIQNIKYAMLEHFSYGNAMSLCSESKKEIKQLIKKFKHEDCENTRRLLSFRKLVESESYENRIKLLTDDDYFKIVLEEEVFKLRKYIRRLHIFLKALWILVCDLPKAPLGKHLREIYSVGTSQSITKSQEYKECFQLLNFQSKEELCRKIERVIMNVGSIVNVSYNKPNKLQEFVINLKAYLNDMDVENNEEVDVEILTDVTNNMEEPEISGQMDRKQLKEKLLGMSKQTSKQMNRYEQIRQSLLNYLSETFEIYLTKPSSMYFHEICFFNDISIRTHIIGEHRAAIHSALNNPHHYLQCNCCDFPETAIRSCMPDISIAYKLHLECGKLINLYDWLQAFVSIIDPYDDDEDDAKRIIHPELQARFTQAVQELEFLGFIKSSKRKADHVTRTTWGG
ncbi:unnamed protein product [Brassicogethes aeneus]|uniref:Origin recognition complex subunit 3 n=1 Tax=Brassicogethes aeneus TaxID=1431903 RepID=A0A9P0FK14_BRAAE|nr:unnamed protein product [Brassicogethes aeneus]